MESKDNEELLKQIIKGVEEKTGEKIISIHGHKSEPMEQPKELTYKVTREQLWQLFVAAPVKYKDHIEFIAIRILGAFNNDCVLGEDTVEAIRLNISNQVLLNEIFPMPKKKVTKEISVFLNIDKKGNIDSFYNDDEPTNLELTVVQLKGTYEVEE